MSKTLYRKYRPKQFSDVFGQNHITKTLQNAIASNRIGHAYLFTGPRGTGKTTVARIFANEINTTARKDFEPVSKEIAERLKNGTSMDIIEIDAASNTGVDDIRKLKETISTTPTEAKFKVYIIDEVHMLSTNAFNALLKTLEEPPEHVIFILATTEIHKVPDTILSRCQRFDFSRFSIKDIIKKLKIISKNENAKISSEALEMIALSANGGMRDAESLLAQVFALEDQDITASEVAQILGTTTSEDVIALLTSFTQSDIKTGLLTINTLVKNGYNIETFIQTILEKLRILMFLSITNSNDADIFNLINIPKSEINTLTKISNQTNTKHIIFMIEECTIALQKTKLTTIVQLPLEVATINICALNKTSSTQVDNTQKDNSNHSTSSNKQESASQQQPITSKNTSNKNLTQWNKALRYIEQENKSLSNLLSQCAIKEINSKTVIVVAKFPFYEDKILQSNNKNIIEKSLKKAFDSPISISVLKDKKDNSTKSSELLSYATQLLGGTVTE